jgi:ribosome-associated protein
VTDRIDARVRAAVEAALDKKAFDLEVLEVSELTTLGDYFVICSGGTERQTTAIADAVEERLRETLKTRAREIEGVSPGRWILMDYGDFIMHIFTEECRRFYSLERLWGDAPDVTSHFTGADEPPKKKPRAKKKNAEPK